MSESAVVATVWVRCSPHVCSRDKNVGITCETTLAESGLHSVYNSCPRVTNSGSEVAPAIWMLSCRGVLTSNRCWRCRSITRQRAKVITAQFRQTYLSNTPRMPLSNSRPFVTEIPQQNPHLLLQHQVNSVIPYPNFTLEITILMKTPKTLEKTEEIKTTKTPKNTHLPPFSPGANPAFPRGIGSYPKDSLNSSLNPHVNRPHCH